jgi:hypothetical protein
VAGVGREPGALRVVTHHNGKTPTKPSRTALRWRGVAPELRIARVPAPVKKKKSPSGTAALARV